MTTLAHPTHAHIPYGPHPRQVFDLWLAPGTPGFPGTPGTPGSPGSPGPVKPKPLYLYIHGGGYSGGDKNTLPPTIRDGLLGQGIHVASMNYRFTSDPEYLACLRDGATALQTIRHRAAEWWIDATRIGAGGGSAGAATAFYLGLCPDQADVRAADPVRRESTRLSCVAAWEIQTSLDPRYIRRLIPGPTWTIASIQALSRLTLDQYETPLAQERFDELAFERHIGPGSPPSYVFNVTPDLPLTDKLEIGPGIHHPEWGRDLKRMLGRYAVECVARTREELPALSDGQVVEEYFRELAGFVGRVLKR